MLPEAPFILTIAALGVGGQSQVNLLIIKPLVLEVIGRRSNRSIATNYNLLDGNCAKISD